ncbi:MAG: crossover junction endodeoxyribonuclease RuvC [Gammaproteobacteria bacterium]
MSDSTILGIDPGSRITGFGIVKMTKSRASYIASGCIRVEDKPLAQRLKIIFQRLSEIVTDYAPHEVAIEKVFMSKNPDSAIKLGQARGVAMVACANHDLPIFEYSANEIKQAIVGRGHADKQQIQHMVNALLSSDEQQADAADALAAAICHGHTADGIAALALQGNQLGRRRRRAR